MFLGNGFLPMFSQGGAAIPWTGATWAVSGGNAYNVPTLGSELLADGGLENWTSATNLTSWVEFVSGGSTVNRESVTVHGGTYAERHDIDASNNASGIVTSISLSPVRWVRCSWWALGAPGKTFALATDGGSAHWGKTRTANGSWNNYIDIIPVGASGTNILYFGWRVSAASSSIYIDDLSARSIVLSSLFATIAGASSTQTAAAKIATLTTSTQAGVVSLLDSASNPQNFLIAYHDGGTVKLDKCVAGVYTNLISVTVSFAANAQIEIRRPSGNTFQLWYNGTQSGTDQTVNDAAIISNTRYGLFSTYDANTFSEFSLGGVVIPFTLPGA